MSRTRPPPPPRPPPPLNRLALLGELTIEQNESTADFPRRLAKTLTSLLEGEERLARDIAYAVAQGGRLTPEVVSRTVVRVAGRRCARRLGLFEEPNPPPADAAALVA